MISSWTYCDSIRRAGLVHGHTVIVLGGKD